MKKYIPMTEAFSRYDSPEAIEQDYPGIFDPVGHQRHVKTSAEGNWVVEDKQHAQEASSRRLSADEMREYLKGGK